MDDDDIWRLMFGSIADRPVRRTLRRDEVRCQRCGKRGLKWLQNDQDQWRLYEDEILEDGGEKQHECNPASADDFEDIS